MAMPEDSACVGCGYDLRAISSDRCPECGTWFDATGELTPTLPWAHRRRLGRVRAYWKTVWLLTRRPSRLGAEISRTVDLAGAKSFRRVTLAIAFLSLAVTAYAARQMWSMHPQDQSPNAVEHAMNQLSDVELGDLAGLLIWNWSFAVSLLVLWLTLISTTATAAWFVQTRKMETVRWNRAGALAFYTCAPLGLMPLAAAIGWAVFGIGTWIGKRWFDENYSWGIWIALLISVVPLFLICFWISLIARLVKYATGSGRTRQLLIVAILPLLWIAIGVSIFVGLHAATAFLILFFRGAG